MGNENISNGPLVSVGILTYNSAKTVLETLESVKAQTYKNIELIISDDASKDDTIEVCRKWIEENKDRFVRCEILTVPENTGIPANANRRIAAAKGEWSKGIAADDLLLPDCVENFVNYVKENPDAKIIFAKMQRFKEVFKEENFRDITDANAKCFCETYKTPKEQYNALLLRMRCSPVTMFAKLEILKEIKYDESFKTIEDYPMWLRLTKAGVKFSYMDKIVAYYRLSQSSISANSFSSLQKTMKFVLTTKDFKMAYIYPNLPFLRRMKLRLTYLKIEIFERLGLLKENVSPKKLALLRLLNAMTSPVMLLKKLKTKQ
ncbi:MAG: glycosyltransferase [Opitutales bacterium]|nr:glycosyltransferase [Opitutales bacterium]